MLPLSSIESSEKPEVLDETINVLNGSDIHLGRFEESKQLKAKPNTSLPMDDKVGFTSLDYTGQFGQSSLDPMPASGSDKKATIFTQDESEVPKPSNLTSSISTD